VEIGCELVCIWTVGAFKLNMRETDATDWASG
jgi:hypothetical protein